MRLHIGVDPGGSGGLAALRTSGDVFAVYRTPSSIREILDVLGHWSTKAGPGQATAILELVHSMPRQGVSSTFKFGKSAGVLECALVAAGISYELVAPLKWMNALKCRTKGDKSITRRKAAALFRNTRVDDAIADALLLAEYGRRMTMNRQD